MTTQIIINLSSEIIYIYNYIYDSYIYILKYVEFYFLYYL